MRESEREGTERRERARLLHLIFVNICTELKCRDKRQDALKKIHDIQIHVNVSCSSRT